MAPSPVLRHVKVDVDCKLIKVKVSKIDLLRKILAFLTVVKKLVDPPQKQVFLAFLRCKRNNFK